MTGVGYRSEEAVAGTKQIGRRKSTMRRRAAVEEGENVSISSGERMAGRRGVEGQGTHGLLEGGLVRPGCLEMVVCGRWGCGPNGERGRNGMDVHDDERRECRERARRERGRGGSGEEGDATDRTGKTGRCSFSFLLDLTQDTGALCRNQGGAGGYAKALVGPKPPTDSAEAGTETGCQGEG